MSMSSLVRPLEADPVILMSFLPRLPIMNGSRWTWTPSRVPGHVLVGPAYALPQSRALTEAYLLVSKPVWGTTMPEVCRGLRKQSP
jgi:hypothetical protein